MHTQDRRRSFRVEAFGAYARCCWEKHVGRYTVQNLSLEGVLLHGGPVLAEGEKVEILLRLPGFGELPLEGLVVRTQAAERLQFELAVRFHPMSADAEDAISAVVTQELQRARHPVLVAAGLRRSLVRHVARDAAAQGVEVVTVRTPLELIRRLEDRHMRVVAVALGGREPKMVPVEIAGFLSSLYPKVRRVLVGRPGWRTRLAARDLVDAVVRPPVASKALVEALLPPEVRPVQAPPPVDAQTSKPTLSSTPSVPPPA